jgi:hypothetical protein
MTTRTSGIQGTNGWFAQRMVDYCHTILIGLTTAAIGMITLKYKSDRNFA